MVERRVEVAEAPSPEGREEETAEVVLVEGKEGGLVEGMAEG